MLNVLSKQVCIMTKGGDGAGKTVARQRLQVYLYILRRTTQALPMLPCCAGDGSRGEIEQVEDELVRVPGGDAERTERLGREVAQVRRDDHVRPPVDGGREHVAVVGVRQGERVDQRLEALDQGVGRVRVHQRAGARELLPGEVRAVAEHGPGPLVVDALRPARPEEAAEGQAHEEVAHGGRVEDARVVEGGEGRAGIHSSPSSWSCAASSSRAARRLASVAAL